MNLFIILLFALPICGYYLFIGLFDKITGYKKEEKYNFEPDNITNVYNNYHTYNNLHVDKNSLENMIENSKDSL